MNNNAVNNNSRLDEKFLPPAVPVRVQCPDFSCWAYRDENGLWREFHTRNVLTSVLGLAACYSN